MPLHITFSVQGDPTQERNLLREIQRRVLQTGSIIQETVVYNLAGPRSGRRYRVPGTRVFYTASAPGEYPAVRTGALRQSVRVYTPGPLQATVGTDVKYGKFLEFKSPDRGGRPWLRRSAEEAWPKVTAIWQRPWRL